MLDPEERAVITDLKDRIIVLLVEQQNARGAADTSRARELQREIDELNSECEKIRWAAEQPEAGVK